MKKKTASSTKQLRSAIEELVEHLGIKKKLLEYEAVTRWESIVGQQIARVTTATRIEKGVLFIKVKTSTWRNELVMRKQDIVVKLNGTIGGEVVKDIKFQ